MDTKWLRNGVVVLLKASLLYIVTCDCEHTKGSGRLKVIEQVHLGFGSHSAERVVLWTTRDHEGQMTVMFAKSGEELNMKCHDYNVVDMPLPDGKSRKYSCCVLSPLLQSTTYFFKIASKSSSGVTLDSRIFSFKTNPDGNQWPVRLLLYGDLGIGTGSLHKFVEAAALQAYTYHGIFHLGDIAYDLGVNSGQIGDEFMRQVEPLASQIPYQAVPGDHESGLKYVQFRNRFFVPKVRWPAPADQLSYYINIGQIHIIAYNTEAFFSGSDGAAVSKLLAWLKADLKRANRPAYRRKRPWLIVTSHRPLYCYGDWRDRCYKNPFDYVLRRSVEKLFFQYGVDLVFAGHEHLYAKTWPVFNATVARKSYDQPMAPVHFTIGTFGSYMIIDKLLPQRPGWLANAVTGPSEHYLQLEAHTSSKLTVTLMDAGTGQKVDTTTIVQSCHGKMVGTEGFASKECIIPEKNMQYKAAENIPLGQLVDIHDTSTSHSYITYILLVCIFLSGAFAYFNRSRLFAWCRDTFTDKRYQRIRNYR